MGLTWCKALYGKHCGRWFDSSRLHFGDMVELVDTADSKSAAEKRGGSTPSIPTVGSSNGRTRVFGTRYLGSNPSPTIGIIA